VILFGFGCCLLALASDVFQSSFKGGEFNGGGGWIKLQCFLELFERVNFLEVPEVLVPEGLSCSDSLLWVVDQHLHDEVNTLIRHMRNQMPDPCSSLRWEVKLDMRVLIPFKPLKHMLLRCAQHIMDLVDLIQLVLAWKQWEKRQDLKEDTSDAPHVHLVVVVALSQ